MYGQILTHLPAAAGGPQLPPGLLVRQKGCIWDASQSVIFQGILGNIRPAVWLK